METTPNTTTSKIFHFPTLYPRANKLKKALSRKKRSVMLKILGDTCFELNEYAHVGKPIFGNLPVAQLLNNFPTFYGT
jgi:hypothetical protein